MFFAKDLYCWCICRVSGATHDSISVQPTECSSVATKGTYSARASSARESHSMFPLSASASMAACTFDSKDSVLSEASMCSAASLRLGILKATVTAKRCVSS